MAPGRPFGPGRGHVLCGTGHRLNPYEGGDSVYQTRAYGRWAGYLFGWSQLAVIRPGDIALMAFVFARYAATLYAPFDAIRPLYAVTAVATLTFLNILGVREGKWTQNVLTVIKFAGLLAIVGGGLWAPHPTPPLAQATAFDMGGFNLALILVLFTFGGWNEMAYVSAEVERDPSGTSSAPWWSARFWSRPSMWGSTRPSCMHLAGRGWLLPRPSPWTW